MANTLLTLRQRLRATIGDGYRETCTTAIAASALVVSTALQKWDGGSNNKFVDWFTYIENLVNAGANRVVASYATASGTQTVRGANFSNDTTGLSTFMTTKYDPDVYRQAIQNAIRKMNGFYFVPLNDTLITGNWLPNAHFDYLSGATPEFYSNATNATISYSSTVVRGGIYSLQVTATAGNGYGYISQVQYPHLLDLAGQTVSLYAWAQPVTNANDCFIAIYTKKADGTAQTFTSTTANPIGEFTRLELEDRVLNSDLTDIQIRFGVVTDTRVGYFDNAYLVGPIITQHLLPLDFRTGQLSNVYLQTYSIRGDYPCDDLHIYREEKMHEWRIFEDNVAGTNYKFLRLPASYPDKYKLHLIGYKPLTVPTTDAGTVEIDDPDLELLIAIAARELYQIQQGLVSSTDKDKFKSEIIWWDREIARLKPQFSMRRPASTVRIRE